MSAHMGFQILWKGEALVALGAGMRPFARMGEHMVFQSRLMRKTVAALMAGIRPLAGMGSLMADQVIHTQKLTAAFDATKTLPCVGLHMKCQRVLRRVESAAVCTGIFDLVCVAFHMGYEIASFRITPVTSSTDIEIHTWMHCSNMRALIIEFREVVPFAIRTFIQRMVPPSHCFAE